MWCINLNCEVKVRAYIFDKGVNNEIESKDTKTRGQIFQANFERRYHFALCFAGGNSPLCLYFKVHQCFRQHYFASKSGD